MKIVNVNTGNIKTSLGALKQRSSVKENNLNAREKSGVFVFSFPNTYSGNVFIRYEEVRFTRLCSEWQMVQRREIA